VNEILFPVGCSFVLYAAQKLGSKEAERDAMKSERFFANDE
jgi:hypothetical protein